VWLAETQGPPVYPLLRGVDLVMQRTYSPKLAEIEHHWHVLDATGVPLGRLCSLAARLLTGKHKPTYAPHLDTGDFVIVVNAGKTVLTGKKEEDKLYIRHSGYPGGLKQETAAALRRRRPTQLVERAVWGMLPKNRLGRRMLRKLKVYAGADHPHQAQQPTSLEVPASGSWKKPAKAGKPAKAAKVKKAGKPAKTAKAEKTA
jgi:large subunit ribosomal protein L13